MPSVAELSNLIDDSAVQLVTELMGIPGKSGLEGQVAEFIVKRLLAAGISEKHISFDKANQKSPIKGEVGNLIVKLPGTIKGPRRLLMAHMDTVPLCVGSQPVRKGNEIRSSNPKTALGGDDRSGCAVLLNTIEVIQKHKLPHPPLTLFFAIQEEIGLVGARYVDAKKLGAPQFCFNFDGGAAHLATVGATGDDMVEVVIHGLASHAGVHPEHGISAIAIASHAINSLVEDGWFGKVVKGKKTGTSNVGIINAGDATNVVTDYLTLRAEVRSHDPVFRAKIVEAYRKAFAKSVKTIKNVAGKTGSFEFTVTPKYEAFRIDPNSELVNRAKTAIQNRGLTPELKISNGGLDANWMATHGYPTVTLGSGQADIHTVKEVLYVDQYLLACQTALELATQK